MCGCKNEKFPIAKSKQGKDFEKNKGEHHDVCWKAWRKIFDTVTSAPQAIPAHLAQEEKYKMQTMAMYRIAGAQARELKKRKREEENTNMQHPNKKANLLPKQFGQGYTQQQQQQQLPQLPLRVAGVDPIVGITNRVFNLKIHCPFLSMFLMMHPQQQQLACFIQIEQGAYLVPSKVKSIINDMVHVDVGPCIYEGLNIVYSTTNNF